MINETNTLNLNVSGGSLKWHLSDSGNNDRLRDLHFSQSGSGGDWSSGSMSVCVGGVWSAVYDGSVYAQQTHYLQGCTKALMISLIYPHNKDKWVILSIVTSCIVSYLFWLFDNLSI